MNDVEQFIDLELSSILARLKRNRPWTSLDVSVFLKRHCHLSFNPDDHVETFERYRIMAV